MITPSYSLTATERVLPRLALDFTTATLDPRVTFTRSGNTATVINSSGVIVGVNADIPRFDYNPTTLVCNGLLIEESRTNVLLNSLIDGTSLATQSVVVTAAARTLSFYGTGQIVLSGAHSATVTGTGAYPTRTTYTFTPSAATLTLTVSGTVQFAQLELGSFATSFIPTTASQVTRSADVATMTGTNFSDWYNATEGAFAIEGSAFAETQGGQKQGFLLVSPTVVSSSFRISIAPLGYTIVDTTTQVNQSLSSFVANTDYTVVAAYKLNDCQFASNSTLGATDTACTIPTVNFAQFGRFRSADGLLSGYIKSMRYWPQRLTGAELQAFSN